MARGQPNMGLASLVLWRFDMSLFIKGFVSYVLIRPSYGMSNICICISFDLRWNILVKSPCNPFHMSVFSLSEPHRWYRKLGNTSSINQRFKDIINTTFNVSPLDITFNDYRLQDFRLAEQRESSLKFYPFFISI